MALTPGSIFESDTTGALETITLSPAPPNTSTQARIASAFYGADATSTPISAPVAADGKSVSIKVLLGIHSLLITITSPSPTTETVLLGQGGNTFATPTIVSHSAVSTLFIKGI
jgi:hypothetical protein